MEDVAHHAVGPGIRELFALINLLVVVAIIYFAGRKGIKAALQNRREQISTHILAAQKELERVNYETEKARLELRDMEKTKSRLMEEMREEGLKAFEIIVRDARSTSDRILQDAKMAADNEVRLASERLKGEVVQRALKETVDMVSKSDSADLRGRLHDKLLERFIVQSNGKERTHDA